LEIPVENSSKFPAFDDAEPQIDQEDTPPSRESDHSPCPEPTPLDTPEVETLEFHSLANIFPLLEGEKFDRLVADINQKGLIENITLTPDKLILDGRNRYLACLKAGVEPKFEITKEPPEKWADFVISKNVHRRQLTGSQCALAAAKLVTTTHGDNRHTLRLEAVPVITQPQAAELFGISDRLVRDALTVLEKSEELQQLVKDGEVPVKIAADVVRNSPKHVATFIEEVKAGKTPVKAKREIEAAKESAPVDDPVRVNDADNGEKADANLAPNRDEECADFLMAEVRADKIPTLISLMESAKTKNVIEIIRRKLQPPPPSDGGATARGQKAVAKRNETKHAMTKGAGAKALQRALGLKLDQFLTGDEPAAKDEELIQELRKAIKAVNGVEGAVSYVVGLGTEMITFKGEPRALGLVAEEVFRAIVDSVKGGTEMKPAEPPLGESTTSVRGKRRGMKKNG
jgi:ParB-like chromosome segregation protein Spo0J